MPIRTIKSTLTLFLTCAYFLCNAQGDFEGPWVLIHSQRIDGSRIVEETRFVEYFEYSFTAKKSTHVSAITYTKSTSIDDLEIKDSRHARGAFSRNMELVADSLLIITDDYDQYQLDKKNTHIFLKKDRYLKYLKTTNNFVLENESTIVANEYIFPVHTFKNSNSTFTHYLYTVLQPCTGVVTGYFTVNKNKEVVDVQMVENRNFDKWAGLAVALKKTSNEWDLPIEGYNYKVPFTFGPIDKGNDVDITFKLNDFEWFTKDHLGRSGAEITLLQNLFERGIVLMQKGNHQKAIDQFTKCIEKNPIYLDAYYNRAYSYQQLNQKENACKDWGYLKDLGQVTAIQLFEQNCKK